jgi:uncharacterized protein (DUF1778 family)
MTGPRKPSSFRISDEEKALFEEAASRHGETVSNWMRRILIDAARKTTRKKD